MPRINLLPWREGQRKERKIAFAVALGISGAAAVLTTFVAYIAFGSMIDAQEARNEKLRNEIKLVDKQIEEINSLENSKQKFIARMHIIEELQRSRPEIVHVFDEIVRTLPDGVYLTAVKQTGTQLKFDGVAQSSTRVSSFMRNIDSSDWLKDPELEVVQTNQNTGPGSNFTLTAREVQTVAAGSDDSTAPKGKKGGKGCKVMASNGSQQ
jgi:type IV pilus assembly protein PilN